MVHQQCKGLFTPNNSITVTVTQTGSTFDLYDGHRDGKNGLHSHFVRQLNVCGGVAWCELALGPVYTKRQRQCCDNSVMTVTILFSLKSIESLENGLQIHSGATLLFSIRT